MGLLEILCEMRKEKAMKKEDDKKPVIKGLKKLRSGFSGQRFPTVKCDNCGCIRYSDCYCSKTAVSIIKAEDR